MRHIFLKHKISLLAILLLATMAVWLIIRILPATEDDIRRSTCLVEGRSTLCLVSGKDTVELRADTVRQQGVWINRHWWWPSCNGRVLTMYRDPLPANASWLTNADSLRSLVRVSTDSLGRLLDRKETERKELQYYLRSHGVIDEGYTQIAAYAQEQGRETDSLKRLVAIVNSKFKIQNSKLRLCRKLFYHVSWLDKNDSLRTVACRPLITKVGSREIIIHTRRVTKPWGAYAVRNVLWGAPAHRKIITVTLSTGKGKGETILATGDYDNRRGHDLPRLFAVEGSPVFTQHGRFIGIIDGKEVRQ